MLALERYLTLYRRFAGELGAGAAVEASLEQVAEVLHCSERNAKLILRKLTGKGFIEWKAGRGRGNRSQITFLQDREKLLLDLSRQYAEEGQYNQAFHLLHTFGEGTAANDKFMEWMSGNFGFHKQQGKHADILRLPITKTIITLDPAQCLFSLDAHLIQQIWDRLVMLEEQTGLILPGIAHEWECNENATTWTFHLRKGVFFHDGTELTAQDVVFTVERLRREKMNNSWIVRTVDSVEAVSERIVRFHLYKPNWLFLQYCNNVAMSILPSGLLGHTEERFWKHPIGTGAFQIEEWTQGKLLLGANVHYYQTRPLLDQVEIVYIPKQEAIKANITSWKQLINPQLQEMTDESSLIQLESNNVCTSVLSWNMNKEGPHQSEQFRSAVDQLLDREEMITELGGYRYLPAAGFFPESEPSAINREPISDEELRERIKRLGFDRLPITITSHNGRQEDVYWIQKKCMDYGIQVQIQIEAPEKLHDRLDEADAVFHALVFAEKEASLIESYEQEDNFLRLMMSPALVRWALDRLDNALAYKEPKDRMAAYAQIEQKLRSEYQVLFMVHSRFYTDYHPSFKGVRINSLGWIDFKHIWRV
ncbi:ABC transporter substrate-binding protein [Paenibacillus sp. CCS19]|uniref:ABC transporter substrate-binding protein n=1 Tax=Paenibacillus sp. CCS19 TaxID=3158387 RepID=UPI002560847A|nr:ABC transporter substrate-binding protein [Paenibacillus cellulosilyticus]GMK39933.1 ABC transporter substrate-binding protein [Paenibacillus cellulosilyticus]